MTVTTHHGVRVFQSGADPVIVNFVDTSVIGLLMAVDPSALPAGVSTDAPILIQSPTDADGYPDAVKDELGLDDVDATRDARLEVLRKRVLGEVEGYLGRNLEHATGLVRTVAHASSPVISLSRWPITAHETPTDQEAAGAVTPSASTAWYDRLGLVEDPAFVGKTVVVKWAGGWSFADSPPAGVEPLPAELEGVLLQLTAARWQGEQGGALGGAEVESVTIHGLGTVRTRAADPTALYERGLGGDLTRFAHVLDRYRGAFL